jgi:outer membrane lipoprotein SlyB
MTNQSEINQSDKDLSNPNPSSKHNGSHPIGTGVGAVMCGAGLGFASGWVGGPVGMAIGTVVGAVAGGLAGREISERIDAPGAKPIEMNP